MKRDKKILIIGFGSIGKRHLTNLIKLGITNVSLYRSKKTAASYKINQRYGIKSYYSIQAALKQKPDAVFITNPTHLHLKYALLAAKARCHLFIEKPLSHNLKNINKLLNLVKKYRLITLVGCNQRFHPQLWQIKQYIDQNTIGRVISARLAAGQYLPDWHPKEDYKKSYAANKSMGGGVILTLIHEIDYAHWLLGKINKIACLANTSGLLKINVKDNAEILLKTKNNTLVEIHLDYLQRTLTRQYQFIGEKGTIFWDYTKSQLSLYTTKTKRWKTTTISNYRRNQMFLEEIEHFLDCLYKKRKSINTVFDAKEVLRIALAARQSAQKNKIITNM